MVVEITISKKKYLYVLSVLMLALCGCSKNNLDGNHIRGKGSDMVAHIKEEYSMEADQISSTEDNEREAGLQFAENAPDLEKCEKLSTALDMLIVYGVEYDEAMQDPDEAFWEGGKSALICNSWFEPFSEENSTDKLWDNERMAAAGSRITGRELTCNCFPDGIDASQAYSPYLAWSSKVNMHTERLAENKFALSYDMMWAPVSMTSLDGMIRVSAVVEENKESPLDGYSIVKLEHEEVFGCVYMVFGEFDYEVSADSGEIEKNLYQMVDGVPTTTVNGNLSELLNHTNDQEYVFADMNGDATDDMILRTSGHEYHFFFYTDEGILWTASPMNSDFKIWFTEDYLVVGKASQSTDEVYAAYQIGSDGNFKQVMLLKNEQDEDGRRFVYVTEQGEKRDITKEEYGYLAEYLESKETHIEWIQREGDI